MNRTHTTTRFDSAVGHLWEVGSTRAGVTLSALYTRSLGPTAQSLRELDTTGLVSSTRDGGFWVFDVVQTHEPGSIGWGPCPIHGRCDMDAVGGDIARPLWARLTAVGVTDGAVYAELEQLLDRLKDAA